MPDIKTFNVKDKSLHQFFKEFGMNNDRQRDLIGDNPYHLMQDSIILKKTSGLNAFDQVVFELEDWTPDRKRRLVYRYSYAIFPYDDVSVSLDIHDFKVELLTA